jgi:hypothetical protein
MQGWAGHRSPGPPQHAAASTPMCGLCSAEGVMECVACIRESQGGASQAFCGASCFKAHWVGARHFDPPRKPDTPAAVRHPVSAQVTPTRASATPVPSSRCVQSALVCLAPGATAQPGHAVNAATTVMPFPASRPRHPAASPVSPLPVKPLASHRGTPAQRENSVPVPAQAPCTVEAAKGLKSPAPAAHVCAQTR